MDWILEMKKFKSKVTKLGKVLGGDGFERHTKKTYKEI